MNNMKFHMMAVGSMITAAILVFVFVEMSKAPPPEAQVDPTLAAGRQIIIHSANWGLNCNQVIEMKRAENIRMGIPVDKLVPVEPNNVLNTINGLCGGKPYCQVLATPEVLKDDTYPRCTKLLEVSYRCFSYDNVTIAAGTQGETITLDCREQK